MARATRSSVRSTNGTRSNGWSNITHSFSAASSPALVVRSGRCFAAGQRLVKPPRPLQRARRSALPVVHQRAVGAGCTHSHGPLRVLCGSGFKQGGWQIGLFFGKTHVAPCRVDVARRCQQRCESRVCVRSWQILRARAVSPKARAQPSRTGRTPSRVPRHAQPRAPNHVPRACRRAQVTPCQLSTSGAGWLSGAVGWVQCALGWGAWVASVLGWRGGFGGGIEAALGLPFFHAALEYAQVVPAGHTHGKPSLG
jgi:hypothetical protein